MKLILVAFALAATAQPQTMQRQKHDHTIYTVHGSPDQLDRFQNEIASQWEGGILLSRDEQNGQYRYWAYSERTAPQAREFMFGNMMSGLRLDIQAYEERQHFPDQRSELDTIGAKCGFTIDPFFITPLGQLRITPQPSDSFQSVDCILSGVKASKTLRALPLGFVGNVASPEKDD